MNRKRTAEWIVLGTGVVLILLVAIGAIVMRSQRFHEFVLAKIEEKASDATGGRVTIQNYRFHWRTLSADVYGLKIAAGEQPGRAPLLQVDHLYVDVKVISLFRRRDIDLNEIVVQHPVVHLVTCPDGSTNIPKPKKSSDEGSSTNIFDLGIKHVLLSNGEIYYDERRQNLHADLRNLEANLTYQMLRDRYTGSLSYREGQIRMGDAGALPHALQASFNFDRNQAKLESATLSVGGSKLWLNASLENYHAPRLSGSYRLVTHPQDFRHILQRSELPSGEIRMEGSLKYDSTDPRPFLRAALAEGKLTSPNLLIDNPQARTNIRSIVGRFVLRNGKLTASLRAGVLTGQLTALLDMTNLDRTPASYVKASLTGISLAEARSALRSPKAQNLPITGTVDAYSEGSWTGPMSTIRARADLTLKGAVSHAPQSGILPVNGAAHVKYNGRSRVVTLTNTVFRTPQSTITLDGQLSRHSSLKIAARTADVRELNEILSSLNGSESGSRTTLASGPAALSAAVTGDMQRPQIAGNLSLQNFTVQGNEWKSLSVDFQASPSQIAVSRGLLVAKGSGEAQFNGRVALRNWTYSAESPLAAKMRIRAMPIRSLQLLAGANYPISGMLGADLNFKGSQLDPAGDGNLQVQQARVYGQTVRHVLVKFKAANRTVNTDLAVQTPAGNLDGTISFRPDTKAYEVHLKAPNVMLASLDAIQARNVPVDGTLSMRADGAGTLDNPQLQAGVEIPQLRIKDSTVQSVRTNLQVANHRATVALDSNFANSFLQGRGTVELRGDYPAEISFDTRALPIETLLAVYKPIPNRDFRGEVELHAMARGPLKNKNRMEVHVTIPTFRAAYQQIQIANAQPIRADLQNAVLRVQPGQLRGTGTELRFDGMIPVAATQPASLNLNGNVDLQILRLFAPDIQSRGRVVLDLRANRTAGNLGVGGQVRLQKVAFSTLTSPMAVQNLNGVLDVRDNQVHIASLEGQTGGGTINAGGTITYRPQLAMDVSLNAKGVRIRYPEGVRAVIDSQLAISGNQQSSTLNGRVLLSSLGFTQDFDLAKFMAQFSGQPTSAPSPGMAQNMQLDVAVQSTSNLQLVSSEVSLEGQVNMRVQGTAAQPVLVGRSTLSNGDVFFMNRRYRLERGVLDFTNPNETKPTVNIVITTIVNQYNLSLTLLGPVDRLRTNYVSDPPLPPVDIINLLARGQTTQESATTNFDANSALAKGLAGQVSSRLQKFAGLSSLQIDPTIGGSNQNPGARIAIQQRVTRNFLFTFSTDVTNAQREVVAGEYQVNSRWSVSAQRDENGGYAFDAKYRRVF